MRGKSFFCAQVCALCVLVALTVGCSSRGSDPVRPPSPEEPGNQIAACPGPVLWGVYDIVYDPATNEMSVFPLRAGQGCTFNVLMFLQGIPPHLGISNVDAGDWPTEGILGFDVSITHPFTGAQLTGFDVMGVVVGNGSIASGLDPDVVYAGENDTTLVNADGYTRWMNPVEFTTPGLFGFTPGKLGTPGLSFTATINGYKYFAQDIGVEQAVEEYFTDPLNMAMRGAFLPYTTNTRRYMIQFPMIGGSPKLRFQYVVLARWQKGDPPYTIDDFPLGANCAETFHISSDASESTTYYHGPTENGGNIVMYLTIYDWQAMEDPEGVVGQIRDLWIESATGMLPEPYIISQADLPDHVLISGPNWVMLLIVIADVSPTKPGSEELLITVRSDGPTTYEPCIPGPVYPEDAHLAAYVRVQVPVAPCAPPENAIFVSPDGDDANPGNDWKNPVAHLSVALQKAEAGGFSAIYAEQGEYTEETTIRLVEGVDIYGGCDPVQCWDQLSNKRSKVVFDSQDEYGAVRGEDIASATLISQMEFHAADPLEASSNSTTVYLDGCSDSLRFEDSWFIAGNGADGDPGAGGVDGEDGAPGEGGGPADYIPHDPGKGGESCGTIGGGGGKAGYGDSFDGEKGESGIGETGGVPCTPEGGDGGEYDPDTGLGTPGGDGEFGPDGQDGQDGLGGDGQGSVSLGVWKGSAGETGEAGQNGCQGAGGGGAGGGFSSGTYYGGAGGGGGGGGCGGGGGEGGHGGGGTFCVFLNNSNAYFSSCRFEAGNGGTGGGGGDRGMRGKGGKSGPGGPGLSGGPISAGGPGGYGGDGGYGGLGGGGGGGISFCVYHYLCSYNPDNFVNCTFKVGHGGEGGDPNAEDGDSGDIY